MYDKLKYFKDNYGRPGYPDQRAVQDFVECENRESVRSFQNALNAVVSGGFNPESLAVVLGKDRLARHGSWEEWARLMMIWLKEATRH